MLFNSVQFLIFLPIVFVIYWLYPKKYKWLPLLLFSYYFYMYWNWKLVFLILLTTAVSYVCGLLLDKFGDRPKIKKACLVVVLVVCFGILLFFKYFNFFYDIIKDVIGAFGGDKPTGYFVIMLPVGISFYTFQTASYVVDVYKGKIKAERHFGYYALFVSFFPQLVAGPIERPQDLLPQLKNTEKSIRQIDYSGALRYMLIGFFKKIAVADILGIFVNAVYNDISHANGLMVLIATLMFAFQIYGDFSGYSDIAVGTAKLFGINLTENFESPYKSKSIKEFWNRWHISLSKWLCDYIYFPLGGSRVKKFRWVLNIFIVFFVSGLWHGANYTFIVWGLMHAAFQIIGAFTLKYRNKLLVKLHIPPESLWGGVFRTIGTFLLVSFAWIFFRANTISDAGTAVVKLFSDYSFNAAYIKQTIDGLGINAFWGVYALLSVPLMLSLEKLKYIDVCGCKLYSKSAVRYIVYVVMAWAVIIAWIYLQAEDIGSSFIYFQF